MSDDFFNLSSLDFVYFFETLNIDIYLQNIVTSEEDATNETRIISTFNLHDYINDTLIVSLIQEYLETGFLKMLLKLNEPDYNNTYLIVEKNIFDKDLYVFYKVNIPDILLFSNNVKTIDYLNIDNSAFETNDNLQNNSKDLRSINVLRLLDNICKSDKDPLINLITDNINQNHVTKLPFYRETSKKKSKNKLLLLQGESTESSNNKIVDPKSFFIEKYYHLLYSINFLSKSSNKDRFCHYIKNNVKISLLKHCDQVVKQNSTSNNTFGNKGTTNTILYKNIIENSVISVKNMDLKYSNIDLRFKDNENKILNQYEHEFDLIYHRNTCIFNNWNVMINSKKINNNNNNKYDASLIDTLINIFKIRELKLQIITSLELLTFTTLDSNFANFDEIYKPKTFSNNIGKKKRNKKINKNLNNSDSLDQCQLLNILVNKLCLTESLIEPQLELTSEEQEIAGTLNLDANFKLSNKKKIKEIPPKIIANWYLTNCLFNEKNDESLLGFYNNCLVPVYKKRLPKCLKFFENKFKGTTFEKSFSTGLNIMNNNNSNSTSSNKLSSMRKAPSKNLQELLNSDTSLLERQDTTFGSTQERLKQLEKRITSINDQTFKTKFQLSKELSFKKIQSTNNLLKRTNSVIKEESENNSNIISSDSPGKSTNQVIEMDGRKFKRAKLQTNRASFQRTGSVKSFSLLDKLAQTFQEPHPSTDKFSTFMTEEETNEEGEVENQEKQLVDELFLKFSQRMKSNSQQLNYNSSDSDMIIKATPQKRSMFIESPHKSLNFSSEIKATPPSTIKKQSPLRRVVLSSGGEIDSHGESIISPNQFTINSSPFKTPQTGMIEEENEEEKKPIVRRKLFPE
ncbi:hypothetical protein ACO0SA_001028 [Hanseniaspora valbyensis]